MAISNRELLRLLEINPAARIIKGNNLLYIDTGIDKVVLSANTSKNSTVLKNIPVIEVTDLDSAGKSELKQEYKYTQKLNLAPKNATYEPRKLKSDVIGRAVPFPELSNTRINTVVNDFFAAYYSPENKMRGQSIDAAFDIYAKTKLVPIDSNNIATDSMRAQIKKVYRAIEKNPMLVETLAAGSKKVLHTKVKALEKDGLKFATTQKVIDTGGRYVMFTDKQLSPKAATTLGTNMQKYFGATKALSVVTPNATHSIIPHKDYVSVDGFMQPLQMVEDFDALKAYSDLKTLRPRVTLSDHEQLVLNRQKDIEPVAAKIIENYAKSSFKTKDLEEARRLLKVTTVGDIKKLILSNTGKDNTYLSRYTINDDVSLYDFLPDKAKSVLSIVKSREVGVINKYTKAQYKRVVKLAESLGIKESAIVDDLQKLYPENTSNLTKKQAENIRYAQTNMLSEMEKFLTHDKVNPSKANTYRAELQKLIHSNAPESAIKKAGEKLSASLNESNKPQKIAHKLGDVRKVPKISRIIAALQAGEPGLRWLDSQHLLSPTVENPLLNLSGNIRTDVFKKLFTGIMQNAEAGSSGVYNQEAMVKLGQLLSQDQIKSLKPGKTKTSSGKNERLTLPRALQQDIPLSTRLAMRRNPGTKAASAYYDRQNKFTDTIYNLVQSLGGENAVEELFSKIINPSSGSKTMTSIADAFLGTGTSGLDMDSSQMASQDVVDTLVAAQQKQLEAKRENPDISFGDNADLTNLTYEELRSGKYNQAAVFSTDNTSIGREVPLTRDSSMTAEELDAFNKSKQVRIRDSAMTLEQLESKNSLFQNKLENGTVTPAIWDDMLYTAAELGYRGLSNQKSKRVHLDAGYGLMPKDLVSFINSKYESFFAEAYPGLKSLGSRVRVNLTTALFRDLARQNRASAIRTGAFNLGYMKYRGKTKWSATDPNRVITPQGKFLSDRYANWAHLIEAAHGDLGRTSIFFDPNQAEVKQDILLRAARAKDLDRSLFKDLRLLYNSNEVYTSRDEALHKELKKADRQGIHGEPILSAKFDVNAAIKNTLAPYNLKPMYAKYGDQYWGKRMAPNEQVSFDWYFDPARRKKSQSSALTIAQKDQALNFIDEANLIDSFQELGASTSDVGRMMREVSTVVSKVDNFVNRQVAYALPGAENHAVMADITAKMKEKVVHFGDQLYNAFSSNKYQTAEAVSMGIHELNKKLSSEINKSSFEYVTDLVADPNKTLNTTVLGTASSHIGKNAAAYATGMGAHLLWGDEIEDRLTLYKRRNKAEDIKALMLDFKSSGYTSPNKIDIQAWLDKRSANTDPQIKAEVNYRKMVDKIEADKANRRKEIWGGSVVTDRLKTDIDRTTAKPRLTFPISDRGHRYFSNMEKLRFNPKVPEGLLPHVSPKSVKILKKFDLMKLLFGRFIGFNTGGKIPGKGHKDEVPALLTKGEVVVDRETSEKLGIHSTEDYKRFKKAARAGKLSHFEDGAFLDNDPFGYAMRSPEELAKANVRAYEESNRVSKKVVINLAADNAYIDMGKTNTDIVNILKDAKNIGIDEKAITAAKGNFLNQLAEHDLGIPRDELKELLSVARDIGPVSPGKLSTPLREKVNALDNQTLSELVSQYKEAGIEGSNTLAKALKEVKKETKSSGTSNVFDRSVKEVAHDFQILSDTLHIDSEVFKNLDKLSKNDIITNLTSALKGFESGGLDLKTGTRSKQRLDQMSAAISSLDRVIGDEGFDLGLRDERSGIKNVKQSVEGARSLRTHAESRISEFGSLTLQNAAFGASYAVIGGVQSLLAGTVGFASGFSDALKNLQAITSETAEGMKVMSNSVKQVSTETKFSALEIAEAGTILGQAGFSAVDISKSLGGVVQLATATGSNLDDATQVLTSTLTIWDKSLTEAAKVSNEFTAAINESKLDVSSLTQAIQYTGNIAASAGISSTDVLTMTGLLKDAGIKRGSTLGTGQRLLYGDFAAPSKKFIDSLETVGIKLEEFAKAFDEGGVYGALNLLKSKGYGLAAASRGMEVREKAIYVAAINQLDKFKTFREDITGTNAAYIANKTQMEGMGNAFKNMLNSWQISMNDSFGAHGTSNVTKLLKALTIAIEPNNPANNLGAKGYTLEEKLRPKSDMGLGIGGAAALAGLGYLGSKAGPAYLNEYVPILKEMAAQGTKLNAVQSTLVSVAKTLEKTSSILKPGIVGAGAAAAGYALAPEGSKIAGVNSALAMAAAFAMSDKVVKFADKQTMGAFQSKQFQGKVNKVAVGALLTAVDSLVVAPIAADNKIGGAIGRGIEGAITGAMLTPGGPVARAAGALVGATVGGVAGYNEKKEAPEITYAQALANIVNDAKGLNAEVGAISKAANSFSDPSNFALRTAPEKPNATQEEKDALLVEKTSKFRAGVLDLQELTKQLKGLEKVLNTSFDLGSVIAATPITANAATAQQRERARLNRTQLPSVSDNRYEYASYSSIAGVITKEVKLFEGQAADAMARSLRSLSKAAYEAQTYRDGASDNFIKQLKDKEGNFRTNKDLAEQLSQARDTQDKYAIFDKLVVIPTKDFLKRAPVLSIKHLDDLAKGLEKAAQTFRINAFESNTPGLFSSLTSSKSDVQLRLEASAKANREIADFNRRYAAQKANIESIIDTQGTRATSAQEAVSIGVEQVKRLIGPDGDVQKAIDTYLSSNAHKLTQNTFTSFAEKSSGAKKFIDKISEGKNKLRDIDVAGVDLVRKLDTVAAKSITGLLTNLGSTLTKSVLSVSKILIPALDDVRAEFKSTMSEFGDLTKVNTEKFLSTPKTQPSFNLTGIDKLPVKANPTDKINIDSSKYKPFTFIPSNFDTTTDAKSLEVDVVGKVDATRINTKALDKNTLAVTGAYLASKEFAKEFVSTVTNLTSMNEAINTGDFGIIRAYDQLQAKIKQAGIRDTEAFKAFSTREVKSRDELKNIDPEVLLSFLSDRKQREFKDNYDRSVESLDTKVANAKESMNKRFENNQANLYTQQDLAIKKAGEDLAYKQDTLAIRRSRALEDISINVARSFQDLLTKTNRAYEALDIKVSRGKEDLAAKAARANADLATKTTRGEEALALKLARGLEDLDLGNLRGTEDIDLNRQRQIDKLDLAKSRSLQDLEKKRTRVSEDLELNRIKITADIELKRNRSIEDVNRSFADNIAKLQRSFNHNLEAIARARQDTLDMFERSLNKPQTLNISPEALTKIANNIGDVNLALDAHKAALTANTTAVLQNNRLQETQESLAKEAYKSAYKKVGGKVYNDDGTINESFNTAYNDYMSKNSEKLVDTVLESAVSAAFSGVGFDVTKALNTPSYMAAQVAAPQPGVTTAAAMVGTGRTVDELITALYDVKSGEVRVQTTAGVILEAQGGMPAANYDLETAMLGIDIKVREAGIAFGISTAEASITLQNALRDIGIQHQRNLEDSARALSQSMDNSVLSFERAAEDINIASSRGMIDISTSVAQSTEDLATKLSRATEDLKKGIARGGEDLTISIDNASADLAMKLAQAGEDLATAATRGAEDINLSYQQGMEDIGTKQQQAFDDLEKSLDRAEEDLNRSYDKKLADIDTSVEEALDRLKTGMDQAYELVDLDYQQNLDNLNTQQQEAIDSFFNAVSNWAKDFSAKFEQGIGDSIFDASKLVEKVQDDINSKLNSGFKISADPIIQNIKVSFETALKSDALKNIGTEFSRAAATAIKTGLKNHSVSIEATITEVGDSFNKVFDTRIVKSIKGSINSLSQAAEKLPDANKISSASTAFSTAVTTATNGFEQSAGKLSAIDFTKSNFATSVAQLSSVPETMSRLSNSFNSEGIALGNAITTADSKVHGIGNGLGNSIESLGDGIARAAATAKRQIDAAIQRANAAASAAASAASSSSPNPTYHSAGGPIGNGYGGGDIVPAMLEPGEFVLKKEIVRKLGTKKLEAINNGYINTVASNSSSPIVASSDITVSMNVQASSSLDMLEQNMELIADGVKRVFEEYS